MAESYCAECGTQKCAGHYKSNVEEGSVESRLPTADMPEAPAPNPFKLGPMTKGER